MKIKFLIFLFLIIFLVGCSNYDLLAQCLTENDVALYGTEWCPGCQEQKKMFGNSFEYINFIDCDDHVQDCQDAEIEGFPTWIINERLYPGIYSPSELAKITGC